MGTDYLYAVLFCASATKNSFYNELVSGWLLLYSDEASLLSDISEIHSTTNLLVVASCSTCTQGNHNDAWPLLRMRKKRNEKWNEEN